LARKPKKSKVTAAAPKSKAATKLAKAIDAKAGIAPKTNGKAVSAAPMPGAIAVRIAVDVPDGTPAYYANFIEISHTKWDFSLIATKLPAKHGPAKLAEMQATGILALPADVTINFPPTLMAGLIRALTTQKEAYEKETKTELKETGDEPVGQRTKRSRRRRASH
jgi:hypothetical protein